MNKPFRNRFAAPRLDREQAERQGRVSRLAFDALRDPKKVIAFLNTHDEALGGRPIDLAVESVEGLQKVEAALAAIAAG